MSWPIVILLNFIGILLGLFLFWRRLKEDYIENQIFSVAFLTILGFVFAYLVSRMFFLKWIFWLPFLLSMGVLLVSGKKFGMRIFEVVDAAVIAYLSWFLFEGILYLIFLKNIQSLILTIINLILFLGFFLIDTQYKKIPWYRSGRTGFTGMFIMGLFFLIRAGVALVAPDMLIFLLEYDVFISGVVSFISFLMIFNLAKI
jgi:hypothetical protein